MEAGKQTETIWPYLLLYPYWVIPLQHNYIINTIKTTRTVTSDRKWMGGLTN